jgi:L-ribulose-5-phosphate 3-epimerase
MNHSLDRREWLQTSAVAGAGLLGIAGGRAPAPANPEIRIFKAVKGGKRRGESPMQFFERLKTLGFDGVESGDAKIVADYRGATAKTGVMVHGKVCSWHWGTRLSSPDAAVRAKGRDLLARDLRDTHTLGGSAVLLVPGKVSGASETHDDVWTRSMAEVRPLLPLASKIGVRILIETVWNGFCESPEKYRDYIDAFRSPWVGAYFDIGNMQKFAPAEEWIRTLGKRIVKLDIKDWGKKARFCRLGEGDVDWDKVRAALAEIGFSGWATREGRDKDLADTSKLIDQLVIGKT